MNTELVQTYTVNKNGKAELVSAEMVECQSTSIEETIAEKEAQLLAMYEEIQALKNNK